jgi:hypothetical protein
MLVPFASGRAEGCLEALRTLALPNLEKLLARLAVVQTDEGDGTQLSMPHERVLAREYGIESPDGLLPWAAWQLEQSGRDTRYAAWAWVTPCHWRVGTGHVDMDFPQDLQLDSRDSQALMAAMQPYFEQDGIRLEYDAPTLWVARGELFRKLPAASLDRVVGRTVDGWMPRGDAARPLRRLQQEMQMLLYTHTVNDERTRGGLLPVNSFWVSGAGALPPDRRSAPPAGLHVTQYQRNAALRGDWPAWSAAWQQFDANEIPRLAALLDQGMPVRLTLCGERQARTWARAEEGLWRRLARHFSRPRAAEYLEPL